jgi:predicted nucleotidyltransferase
MDNYPDIETIKKIIYGFVTDYPRITKAYLYGSYVKKDKSIINDIDIAIEISSNKNDTAFGFWCANGRIMQEQLGFLLNYKVHLEWFDLDETPTVRKGLEEGNILLWPEDRNNKI